MLLTKDPKTEDKIIAYLSRGPILIKNLVAKSIKEDGITFQAVYKALLKMRYEEIIVKNKQIISLSIPWVYKLTRFTEQAIKAYSLESYNSFLGFREKQKNILTFRDFTNTYIYWVHMMISLAQEYREPIFLYNSHDWYALARPDLKADFFTWLERYKRPTFMLIGHDTVMDQKTAKKNRSDYLQIGVVEKKLFNDWSYIVVIGDFVLETRCEKETALAINKIYQKYQTLDDSVAKELLKIASKKQIWKIIITRNKDKAKILRKKLSKYFYIPKQIKDKI
jgi:hypothetical protein